MFLLCQGTQLLDLLHWGVYPTYTLFQIEDKDIVEPNYDFDRKKGHRIQLETVINKYIWIAEFPCPP
jgi:hypothetical protein